VGVTGWLPRILDGRVTRLGMGGVRRPRSGVIGRWVKLWLVEVPETRYAATAVGKIAYQIFGDGPVDIVVWGRSWLPIDLMWDEPRMVRFLQRLGAVGRQLWFDPRGRGASDPLPQHEGRLGESVVSDIVSLLDAVGWPQVALVGLGGTHEVLFAATHPERVRAMVLVEPAVRYRRAPDYPEGWDSETMQGWLDSIERNWGTGANLAFYAPNLADDRGFVRWFARCERAAMSPAEAGWRYRQAWNADLRHVLPTIRVPTLVVGGDDRSSALSRYVAKHIPGCRRVDGCEPGQLFFTGDTGPILDSVEEFLTGRLPARDLDRVLATLLFTDVVASTERSAQLGDRRWLEVLADHDTIVRAELARFRGNEVKTTGDGFLATFDGPARAVRAAQAITQAVRPLGIYIRSGLHTGEIERADNDIGGITVHIAQRISTLAPAGGILVSNIVKELASGSGITFEDDGDHLLKGVPGPWRLFRVTG
jgi:class 3 adenylate cyclase/pimeloyl-ACP methyl ester carboxylesterase